MNKIDSEIKNVKQRLSELSNKKKLIELFKGILLLIVIALSLNVSLSTLELLGLNSVGERTILFFSGIVLLIISSVFLFLLPLINFLKPISRNEYHNLAKFVGENNTDIKDGLLNVIQLAENENASELKDAAILELLNKTENINFKTTVSYRELNKTLLFAGVFIVSCVMLFFSFSELRKASIKILNYSQEYSIPPKYSFYIEPQNKTVTKGENVNIVVSVVGPQPKNIKLFLKDEENQSYIERVMVPDTAQTYSYSINSIKNNTNYFVMAEDIVSDEYLITVIDKPIIKNIEVKITPPKYTLLESSLQTDNGNIDAIWGSGVELKISSSKELNRGTIVFNDSTKKEFKTNSNNGIATFKVTKNDTYKIKIVDVFGNTNENPIEYKIKSKLDIHPSIEVMQPKENITLTKSEMVLTEVKIEDDFGFDKLTLNHKLIESNFGIIEDNYTAIKVDIQKLVTQQKVIYSWSVTDLMLAAGDIVSFYFEVFDNDNVSGPKSTKSKIFQLRVPTMEELFNNVDLLQDKAQIDLEKTLKEAEKLKEDIKNLSNELKKDEKEITWEENKKIKETAKRLENLQEQIKEAQKKIEEAKENLSENELLSKETLQKYNELQELMDEMNSEDMKNALQKLQEQMESMNRNEAQQNMSDMEFNEEMFKKSIERTVNLLKRIQIEQKMDEVIKRTEELQKNIDELKNETEKSDISNQEEKERLAKKENEISEQLEKLKEEMNKLQEKMSEFKEMPNESMKDIKEKMDSQKNEELSKEMMEMLQKNMKMSAMENMEQLSNNMEQMKNQMQQMQQQMQQQNQMEVLFKMMKGINNLISLSKEEEALKNSMQSTNPNSDEMLRNVQKQNEIADGLDKTLKGLSELSQKTFAITPEMGQALGNAKKEMNNAMQAMQNKNSSMAMLGQTGAMKYLNQAATMMKGNMEQMMNGGGQGGGMMSMMQQMQQLSQQQMGLNQLTKQMQKGRLTPQQQAGMERLAQQQELIRKSLEQLNKENKEKGVSKTLTSNLEKVLEEMKEVISGMNTKKIDDELIKNQEKILSKLLDAQRSINERDFEKNRESKSASNFNRKSPEELKLDASKNKIRDELLKIINEGYSKDYEDLIRKYYEILEKEKENEISR